MSTRVTTAMTMGLREFRRTPVLLGLLVVLPVYYIGAFMYIVPTSSLPLTIGSERVTVALPDLIGALMTPVTAGLLSGIVGLFLMHSSKAADDRLRLAGFRSRELIIARVGLLAAGGLVVSIASLAVVLVGFTPTSIPGFVAATLLAALTYGVLGVVVGVTLDRLPGIYVMLFLPVVDMVLLQNPLANDPPAWVTVLPGHFVTKATMDVAFTGGIDAGNFVGAIGYVLALLFVAVAVFYRATEIR